MWSTLFRVLLRFTLGILGYVHVSTERPPGDAQLARRFPDALVPIENRGRNTGKTIFEASPVNDPRPTHFLALTPRSVHPRYPLLPSHLEFDLRQRG